MRKLAPSDGRLSDLGRSLNPVLVLSLILWDAFTLVVHKLHVVLSLIKIFFF